MVKYFVPLLFCLLLFACTHHEYGERYVIFPQVTPDSESFVVPEADRKLVLDVVKAVLIRTEGQAIFMDYTKFVDDPDVLALYIYRGEGSSYMSVGIATHKGLIEVYVSGRNIAKFYRRMSHSIYCDLRDFCKAARVAGDSSSPELVEKCREIVSAAPGTFVPENILPPSGH